MNDALHPDIMDALVRAGWSAGMLVAAYRALWTIARQEPQRDATDATLHATGGVASNPAPRPMTSTERSRKRRALLKIRGNRANAKAPRDATPPVACNVVVAYPSLSEDSDLNQRERGVGGPGGRGRRVPLPADWQPDAETSKLAAERLGDAAQCCLDKFRDHFADSGEVRTLKGWQGAARKWVRNERLLGPQRSLPLMVPVASPAPQSPPADPLWQPVYAQLAAKLGENVAAAWFRDCRLAVEGETATVLGPTRFLAHYLTANFEGPVLRALGAVHAGVTRVKFIAGGAAGNLPAAPETGPPIARTG
jgi:hypothetical protein